ncbi:MAG: hypothetical protein GY805_39765 [Chloroflexi bacterium]|nr:hypothetical protein [Chloroflexota bacterium]
MDIQAAIENIDLYLGFLANIISTLGIPFAVWRLYTTWQKDKQMQQEIGIDLFCEEKDTTIRLPVNLKREDFSRAEILGYLGMVVKSGVRYDLGYLGSPEFFQNLQRIQNSKTSETLIIPCTPAEIAQFKKL